MGSKKEDKKKAGAALKAEGGVAKKVRGRAGARALSPARAQTPGGGEQRGASRGRAARAATPAPCRGACVPALTHAGPLRSL